MWQILTACAGDLANLSTDGKFQPRVTDNDRFVTMRSSPVKKMPCCPRPIKIIFSVDLASAQLGPRSSDTITETGQRRQVPRSPADTSSLKGVGRTFDAALEAAGSSLSVRLILLNLKVRKPGTQRELAGAVGITEATLTHHLNTMDVGGFTTPNRRVQVVQLTQRGDEAFLALRAAAIAFDEKPNAVGLTGTDQAALTALLDRQAANAGSPEPAGLL